MYQWHLKFIHDQTSLSKLRPFTVHSPLAQANNKLARNLQQFSVPYLHVQTITECCQWYLLKSSHKHFLPLSPIPSWSKASWSTSAIASQPAYVHSCFPSICSLHFGHKVLFEPVLTQVIAGTVWPQLISISQTRLNEHSNNVWFCNPSTQ